MVALLGQHRELVTKALSNVVPSSINDRRLGMCLSVSTFTSTRARSSVRIRIRFGGFGFCLLSLLVSSTEGKQAVSVKQAASSKRKDRLVASALFIRTGASQFGSRSSKGYRKAQPGLQPLVVIVELARLQSTLCVTQKMYL